MIDRQPCGCKHNGSRWLEMCAAHKIEYDAHHLRAQKEKDAAELLGAYYLVPDQPARK